MKSARSIIMTIISIGLLVLLVYAAYRGVVAGLDYIAELETDTARVVVGGVITIVASIITVSLGKLYESREKIREANRSRRVPVYEALVEFVFDILQQDKTRKKMTEKEMMSRFAKSMEHMIVWSSDSVLKEFSSFRTAAIEAADDPAQSTETVFSLERLLFSIRKDLGHKNSGLKKGDLLRFFVTDIDEHVS